MRPIKSLRLLQAVLSTFCDIFPLFAICVHGYQQSYQQQQQRSSMMMGAGYGYGQRPQKCGLDFKWSCGATDSPFTLSLTEQLGCQVATPLCPRTLNAINNCCVQHDACYSSRMGQAYCDEVFCQCLCVTKWDGPVCALRVGCGFCTAVRLFGGLAYASGGHHFLIFSTPTMSSSQSRTPKTSTGSMISSSSFSTGNNNAYRPIRPASTSTIPIPTHPQQQHQQEQQQPPALVLKSAVNGAKGFAANLRRESMTKLDIVDGADEDKSMMSSKKVSLLVPPSARERQPSLDSGRRPLSTSGSVSKNAYKLPASLADSQVAQEKPTMRTRLVVCLLSGCMILFCLIKLFYWK